MCEKRGKILFVVICVLFMSLTARVFYLQFFDGARLAKAAAAQRVASATLDKPRGDVLDKNGIPLTNRSRKVVMALEPLSLRGKEDEILQICNMLGVGVDRIEGEINTKREPVLVETDEEKKDAVMGLGFQGVSVINSLKRYDGSSVARHILGYLNQADQVGGAGIEKFYEDVLQYNSKDAIGVFTDARSNLVQGLGYRLIRTDGKVRKLDVKLTLDYHVQRVVEDVMDKNHVTGAVVVEDVYTGDILAMASKPDFDQNDVGSSLNRPGNELFNRAVASYNLGSIFKIIDVAALFEKGMPPDQDYFCNGFVTLGDREFRCSSYEKGGHGAIGLTQAFALSCNPYFIEMGLKIGRKDLLDMAAKFGLGTATGIRDQGIGEAAGNLPGEKASYTDGDTANISIGQGDIMATPLQVADIAATVANGGMKNRVNIVDSVVDDDGNQVRDMKAREGTRVISKANSDRIRYLMEQVTEAGTGTKAKLEEYGGAGGKTGSAETGQYVDGQKVVHAWFAGYFPKRTPRYSMAVFIENGRAGGEAAAPVFAEIAAEMVKKGY